MTNSVIEANALTVHYQQGPTVVHALEDVNLTVLRGEFLVIVGRSGSGKTTLLDCMGLLLTPTSGTVRINGIDASAMSDGSRADVRAANIGFVFQDFNLVPSLTALENTMLPLRYRRGSRSDGKRRARLLLDEMGLSARLGSTPDRLSGGEQQRVALARALVNEPSIVLADEPTGEVDSETRSVLLSLMRRINEEDSVTFVIVTHDLELAQQANRVVMLRDGRIATDSRFKRDERVPQAI